MKFKQFLTEKISDADANKWLYDAIYWLLPKGAGGLVRACTDDKFEHFIGVKDGKIETNNNIANICFKNVKLSDFPFNSGAWIGAGEPGKPFPVVCLTSCAIDTWENMPLCETLVIDNCTIDTLQLKGHIKYKAIYSPTMSINGHDTKINCGMLGLLKQERFKEILSNNSPEDIKTAIEIINKHIGKDPDIAEVVEEMHDAGLEEYAKL